MSNIKRRRSESPPRVELTPGVHDTYQREESLPRLAHLSSRLTERQLGELASRLLKEPTVGPWEDLVLKLGLSEADVYKHKVNNMYNKWSQCFGALVQWRRRNDREATVETIVMACQQCYISYNVYEFLLPS